MKTKKDSVLEQLRRSWGSRALAPVLGFLLSGCWSTPNDDAGDEVWAAEMITVVQGRRAASHNEVRALARLAEQRGRGAVIDVLTADPKFVEYWTLVLMDDLEVERVGGNKPDDLKCYTQSKLNSVHYDDLVEHLRTKSHDEQFCPDNGPWITLEKAASPVPAAGVVGQSARAKRSATTTALSEGAARGRAAEAATSRRAGQASPAQVGRVSVEAQKLGLTEDVHVTAGRAMPVRKTVTDEAIVSRAAEDRDRVAELAQQKGQVVRAKFEPIVPGAQSLTSDTYVDELGAASPINLPRERERLVSEARRQKLPLLDLDLTLPTLGCQSFTMKDAFEAAISEDALDALYRAALAPQATHVASRGAATGKFMRTYLDRDPTCMQCHGTNYSTTDGIARNENWDRFDPATPTDLESSAFSYMSGSSHRDGAMGGPTLTNRIRALFRADSWSQNGGLQPFGMDASCVSDGAREGFTPTWAVNGGSNAGFAGLNGSHGLMSLVDQFAVGVNALSWNALEPAPYPVEAGSTPGDATAGAALYAACTGCHQAGNTMKAPPNLLTHTRRMSPARLYSIITQGSPAGLMGPQMSPGKNARDLVAYIKSRPGQRNPVVYNQPAAGFAHLVAMNIVDNVFEEISGSSLIMEHGFPRNPEAGKTLDFLTRIFVEGGWSLKNLVRRIALSDHMGRRAPADSPHDPYELPMVVNPWADVPWSPNKAIGESVNGQGDLSHRWSVTSLLSSVSFALGWPAPKPFPDSASGAYADTSFLREFGGYASAQFPGFHAPSFPALLAWEGEVGTCQNPTDESDYIDVLTDPAHELTLSEAMLAVKDRLLGDGQWWTQSLSLVAKASFSGEVPGQSQVVPGKFVGPFAPSEYALASQLTSLGGLNEPAADDPGAVRDYCAALLKSPQFLLAGLPPFEDDKPPPNVNPKVPCVDGLCSYLDYCGHYSQIAENLGHEAVQCLTITLPGKFKLNPFE